MEGKIRLRAEGGVGHREELPKGIEDDRTGIGVGGRGFEARVVRRVSKQREVGHPCGKLCATGIEKKTRKLQLCCGVSAMHHGNQF